MEVLDFTFERRLELTARDSREEGREEGREEERKRVFLRLFQRGIYLWQEEQKNFNYPWKSS